LRRILVLGKDSCQRSYSWREGKEMETVQRDIRECSRAPPEKGIRIRTSVLRLDGVPVGRERLFRKKKEKRRRGEWLFKWGKKNDAGNLW